MKILLLNPGGPGIMMRGLIRERPNQFGFCWPSVDLLFISGYLNEKGYTLKYIDASIDNHSALDISQMIHADDIRVVISLFSHFYHVNDLNFLKTIRDANPQVKIVILPDIQFVLNPETALEFMDTQVFLDALVMSIINNDLDKYLTDNTDNELTNICFRKNGKAVMGSIVQSGKNGDSIPIPRHDLFKNKKYFLPESRHLYVTSTTMQFGCPHQCDFCLDKEAYKKCWCRSAENMVEEFEYIASCGFNEVYVRDLTFGLNRSLVIDFCKRLIKKNLPLQWVCSSRVDTVDEELLTLMKQAGCMCIEFGIESGLDSTKDAHKKKINNEQALKTFYICRELGIDTAMFMIIGFPEENIEDVQRSLQFAFDLKGDFLSLNIANILPGTGFGESYKMEFKADENDSPWENYKFDSQNFVHPTISSEKMTEILQKILRRFYMRPAYIVNRLLKMRSAGAFLRVIQIGFSVLTASFSKKVS